VHFVSARAHLPAANSLQKRRNEFTSCLSSLFIREKRFKFAIKSVASVMRDHVENAKRKSAKRKPPSFMSDSSAFRISDSGLNALTRVFSRVLMSALPRGLCIF